MSETDPIHKDLAGLINVARRYGPDSEETKRYVAGVKDHYHTKKALKEWRGLASTILLVIDEANKNYDPTKRGALSLADLTGGELSVAPEGQLSVYRGEEDE